MCEWYHLSMKDKLIIFWHFKRVTQNLNLSIEAFSAWLMSECFDYRCVKTAVLKEYELVAEAY